MVFTREGADTDGVALKPHVQFAHPTADRLKSLLKNAGKSDPKLFESIKKTTETYRTAQRYGKLRSREIVAMSMAASLNDTLSAHIYLLSWM